MVVHDGQNNLGYFHPLYSLLYICDSDINAPNLRTKQLGMLASYTTGLLMIKIDYRTVIPVSCPDDSS